MLFWIENHFGESASIGFAIFFLFLVLISDTWEWVVWFRLRRQTSPSRMRSRIEFTSIAAGTMSFVMFALIITLVLVGAAFPIFNTEWAIDAWIFTGAAVAWLSLLMSIFNRAKLRIAGATIGLLMSWFWWEFWEALQFARAYP